MQKYAFAVPLSTAISSPPVLKVSDLKNSAMAFNVASLLCPFIVALDIFMLKKDTAKMHCNNVELNVLDNAPLIVYQAAVAGHWLIMASKPIVHLLTRTCPKWRQPLRTLGLSRLLTTLQSMECEMTAVAIPKAMSTKEPKWTKVMLTTLWSMECEMTAVATPKATFTKEPKWTTVMARNMR
ncbi:unnamed protein product [Sphagnum tenellum]